MADAIDICNLALNRIGKRASVSNIDPPDGSDESYSCARFYPLALQTILNAHNWAFATKRASLAKMANVDASPWKYGYALPSNCLRVINLQLPDAHHPTGFPERWFADGQPIEFEVVNGGASLMLLTNVEKPVARYIMNNPPESFFSATFSDALAWLLASYLAGLTIRGETSFNYMTMCYRQYEATLKLAAQQDSSQTKMRIRRIPYAVRSRHGC